MPSAAVGPSTSRSLPMRPTPVMAGSGAAFSPGNRSLSSGPLDKVYPSGPRGQRVPIGCGTATATPQDIPGSGIMRAPMRRPMPPPTATSNGGPDTAGRAAGPGDHGGNPSGMPAASGGSVSLPASRMHTPLSSPQAITSHISNLLGIKLAPCSVPLFQVQAQELRQYANGPQV